MLRTNTNQYKNNMAEYVRECIDTGDVSHTLEQCLQYASHRYATEYNHEYNQRTYPNHQDRLAHYLSGLPFDFDFTNYAILKAAAQLHEVDEIPEDKQGVVLDQWFSHLALHIIRLGETFGILFR